MSGKLVDVLSKTVIILKNTFSSMIHSVSQSVTNRNIVYQVPLMCETLSRGLGNYDEAHQTEPLAFILLMV